MEYFITISIYTDGSCRPTNPGPGGWAFVSTCGLKVSGGEAHTTNNRMEVMAAIATLEQIPDDNLRIYSDSLYLINTMTKGWKKKKNTDLWERLLNSIKNRHVEWIWVKGHNDNYYNEIADQLAGEAAIKVVQQS